VADAAISLGIEKPLLRSVFENLGKMTDAATPGGNRNQTRARIGRMTINGLQDAQEHSQKMTRPETHPSGELTGRDPA
jgi:hypothetical protein